MYTREQVCFELKNGIEELPLKYTEFVDEHSNVEWVIDTKDFSEKEVPKVLEILYNSINETDIRNNLNKDTFCIYDQIILWR